LRGTKFSDLNTSSKIFRKVIAKAETSRPQGCGLYLLTLISEGEPAMRKEVPGRLSRKQRAENYFAWA
jgi:hypothetical protein